MNTQALAEKAELFRQMHHGPGVLVLANVWDVATARLVEVAGLRAVGTSSAAIAHSMGYPDDQRISRAEMLSVVERIASHVSLPVTADLEAGYGESLEDIAETTRAMIAAGAVGLNFQDGTGDPTRPLYEPAAQAEKIRCIRKTADSLGVPVVINARTDVYLGRVGDPSTHFDQAVSRANAYRRAGADCLFVPGVQSSPTIAHLVRAINGPLNILAGPAAPSIEELHDLGVARVSFGSWPMRACMGFFARFAREVRDKGTFRLLLDSEVIPYVEMNKLLAR
jgi:2-methylisocitrate lyase-like PEP mutase family enzyme